MERAKAEGYDYVNLKFRSVSDGAPWAVARSNNGNTWLAGADTTGGVWVEKQVDLSKLVKGDGTYYLGFGNESGVNGIYIQTISFGKNAS